MWNPSIEPNENMLYEDLPFQELCSNFHEYYAQHLNNFKLMATVTENLFKKYGIEGMLDKGVTDSMVGNLILNIKLSTTYKVPFGDPEYDIREKVAYDEDYMCEFTIVLQGSEHKPRCVLGLKIMTQYGIMMAEVPNFDAHEWDKQEIPRWYVDGVKAFLT